MSEDNITLTPLTFERAKELVPDGIQKLVDVRCELDEVSETYGELYVAHRYEFFQDTRDRVWVVTDFPEEPGIWIPSINMWLGESESDDEIVKELKEIQDERMA
jgi:hypothetical protein